MDVNAFAAFWILLVYMYLLKPAPGEAKHPTKDGMRDYCQFESFDASCRPDEVILIKAARYGRMRVGRCVSRDYGFIGCVANVLGELDRRCSGRKKCHFNIPSLRDIYQPCPKDLTAYLEASFECVKVDNLVNKSCSVRRPLKLNATSGYLSSLPVTTDGPGSTKCPITITAQPGQTINFTLFSLNLLQLGTVKKNDICPYQAIIRDGDVKNVSVSLCAAGDNRKEGLYVSKSSIVNFHIEKQNRKHKIINSQPGDSASLPTQVLLQYDVVGCPDPRPPSNAWMQRRGDRAVIKCNHTSETWYLTCRGHNWVGTVSNCTKISPWSSDKVVSGNDTFPLGLLIAVAIGVIVGIIMGIVMLVFVFFYRRKARRRKLRNKAKTLLEDDTSQENEENYARRLMQGDVSSMSSLTKHGTLGNNCHGEYTQMWELRRSQAGLGHQVAGSDSGLDSGTYSTGTASISGNATLPTCCNSKTTFITFKPREPTYERGRFGLNTLLQKNGNGGLPFSHYFELDPSADRHTESDSNDETYKRPDLITNSNRKNSDAASLKNNANVKHNNQCTERQCNNGGLRDLCDHCVLHPTVENKPPEDASSANVPPSV